MNKVDKVKKIFSSERMVHGKMSWHYGDRVETRRLTQINVLIQNDKLVFKELGITVELVESNIIEVTNEGCNFLYNDNGIPIEITVDLYPVE